MKRALVSLLWIVTSGCADEADTHKKNETNDDDLSAFETKYSEVTDACTHLVECAYLNDGVDMVPHPLG